jgi:predicted pyridoxine 5'-phosphate oxidase superfamily flavin-nucleotide-binding protein
VTRAAAPIRFPLPAPSRAAGTRRERDLDVEPGGSRARAVAAVAFSAMGEYRAVGSDEGRVRGLETRPKLQEALMYHAGQRALQARFGSTALADRLLEVTHRTAFSDGDKAFIEEAGFFFLATADADGRPDCSFKGGLPGFVRVVASDQLVFPDYDGNGMFRSLGNIETNPQVGLLFIAMGAAPKRLRVNGRAALTLNDPLMATFPGAQALVRVTAEHIFPNCPRYIPDVAAGKASVYAPAPGIAPVEPAWKGFDSFKDVVPPRKA